MRLVLAVAITGSVPRKADNPAVPITVAEQIIMPEHSWIGRSYSPISTPSAHLTVRWFWKLLDARVGGDR